MLKAAGDTREQPWKEVFAVEQLQQPRGAEPDVVDYSKAEMVNDSG